MAVKFYGPCSTPLYIDFQYYLAEFKIDNPSPNRQIKVTLGYNGINFLIFVQNVVHIYHDAAYTYLYQECINALLSISTGTFTRPVTCADFYPDLQHHSAKTQNPL